MKNRIAEHLDMLLEGAPKTRLIEDMRQELLAGCLDKYDDLIADGMSEEEAFYEVAEGIGDVDELLGIVEKQSAFDPERNDERRKKRALFVSIGIIMYFAALSSMIFMASIRLPGIGAALMFIALGLGTVSIVYGVMTTSVKYEKTNDTLVEEIKEQMTSGSRENRLHGLASSTLWCLVVVVYFAASFFSKQHWHLTWLIFVLGAVGQLILTATLKPSARKGALIGAFWCAIMIVYFLLSFGTSMWAVSWLIFPFAVMAQQAVRLFYEWRRGE